jgi:hypothetical protein
MKQIVILMILINYFWVNKWAFAQQQSWEIDTDRFVLGSTDSGYNLIDSETQISQLISRAFLINPTEEKDEEEYYVNSFIYSDSVNAFKLGGDLIGVHLSSFSAMSGGSAMAAAGRDLFLIYDQGRISLLPNKLDFGITKQRQKMMGCLNAISSHFILGDVDQNGFTDIGVIGERINCEYYFDPERDLDIMGEPKFDQGKVKWYTFEHDRWIYNPSYTKLGAYIDLPLIDIVLNPIDYFAFILWSSYDPKEWIKCNSVTYYPQYRLRLITKVYDE